MTNYDLISVIIPIYKVEKYLNRCIESIVNQTYKNLEIILVDDGSPDKCPEICDDWAKKDQRICVIHKENGGLSDARNAGLKIAHGEWISFVDSDDFLADNMMEKLYQRCIDDKSDMAICNFMCVDERGNQLPEMTVNSPLVNEVITSGQAVGRVLSFEAVWYYIMVHCKLYNRYLFSEILFPKGKLHEDVFVMYRLYEQCQRISIESKACYYYTQRNDSIMGKPYSVRNLDVVEGYIEQAEHFMNNGMRNFASYAMLHAVHHLMYGYIKLDLKLTDNKGRYEELKGKCNEIYCRYKRDIKQNFSIKMRIKCRLFFTDERILCVMRRFKSLIKR